MTSDGSAGGMTSGGRAILVTGGSRGIGAALVRKLVRTDRIVYLNHRDSADAAASVEAEASAGGPVRVVRADLSDRTAVREMMQVVREECGRLDVLVHNAAAPLQPRRAMRLDWERDIEPQLAVSCRGLLNCVQEADDLLVAGSQILTVLTDSLFHRPPVQMGAYLTAKGAAWGLTRALAKELQPRGVRVNMVSPSMVGTELWAQYGERAVEIMAAEHPLRRTAAPAEIAGLIAALIEGAGEYLQGTNVIVNGGTEF